jgi:hypothetical protein
MTELAARAKKQARGAAYPGLRRPLALVLFAFGASSSQATSAGAAGQPGGSEEWAALRTLIGDAACERDDQCRTVAVGHKACGGPEAYIAWSTLRTDPKQLEAAAGAYGRRRDVDALPGRRVSDCLFVTDPGAACLPAASGRACKLRPRGSLPTR